MAAQSPKYPEKFEKQIGNAKDGNKLIELESQRNKIQQELIALNDVEESEKIYVLHTEERLHKQLKTLENEIQQLKK